MSRALALGILSLFAALFVAAAWWGWSDLRAWRTAMAVCATPLMIEQSSFWMMGMAAIAVLPLLGVSTNVMVHRVLFSVLILWGLGVPMLTYIGFLGQAEAQGYAVPEGGRLLMFGNYDLHAQNCF